MNDQWGPRPDELAAVAREDGRTSSDPERRVRMLELVVDHWPTARVTEEFLTERCVADADPAVRMRAMTLLGDDGRVHGIATRTLVRRRAVADPDPGVRAEASRLLVRLARREVSAHWSCGALRPPAGWDRHGLPRRLSDPWPDDEAVATALREHATDGEGSLRRDQALVLLADGWGDLPGTAQFVRDALSSADVGGFHQDLLRAAAARWPHDPATWDEFRRTALAHRPAASLSFQLAYWLCRFDPAGTRWVREALEDHPDRRCRQSVVENLSGVLAARQHSAEESGTVIHGHEDVAWLRMGASRIAGCPSPRRPWSWSSGYGAGPRRTGCLRCDAPRFG